MKRAVWTGETNTLRPWEIWAWFPPPPIRLVDGVVAVDPMMAADEPMWDGVQDYEMELRGWREGRYDDPRKD